MLRLLVSPKWMTWHVLTLGAMVTCGFLAAWQWGRAGSAMGSAVNIGYGLQWPLFAVFFGYMWWRFLRMELADVRAAAPGPDARMSSGERIAAGRDAADGRPAGTQPGTRQAGNEPAAPDTRPTSAPADAEPGGSSAARRSPFTPRPADVHPPRHTDPQLRAYNEELARLAARHREETTT